MADPDVDLAADAPPIDAQVVSSEEVAPTVPTEVALGLEMSFALSGRFGKHGPHPHYQKFANSTMPRTGTTAFDFIRDALDGAGGFETGEYLDPHTRELPALAPTGRSGPAGTVTSPTLGGKDKFAERRRLADYDAFPRAVNDAYWSYIVQQKDEIKRETEFGPLQDFWRDADLRGSDITTFMSGPELDEMRPYGHACVIVDRPNSVLSSNADNQAPANRPYAYVVPTRNLVDWEFDDNGVLVAVVIVEPPDEVVQREQGADPNSPQRALYPLRIWTRWTWSIWNPVVDDTGEALSYELDEQQWGENPLGEVPMVLLYNGKQPSCGQLMGTSEMRNVCLLGKTVYNLDSEKREIERNCAFPMLTIPAKNPRSIRSVQTGTRGGLAYDGPGAPQWLTANLESLQRLQESRDKKVDQAYGLAKLRPLVGTIETTSGFHAEAEFDETNRAIGQNAAMLEDAEAKIARLVMLWYGISDEMIRDGNLFTISYPRTFRVRDVEQTVLRATQLLTLRLGRQANQEILRELFGVLWPRKDAEELEALAISAAENIAVFDQQLSGIPALGLIQGPEQERQRRMQERVRGLVAQAGYALGGPAAQLIPGLTVAQEAAAQAEAAGVIERERRTA